MAQRQRRAPLAPARASAGSSSSGSSGQPGEEDSDASLNAEFQRASDPQRLQRMASHLELAWTISKSRSPEQCDSCRGAREKECEWCHGTGVLMVGDMLFCSLATHDNKCPICKGTGQCKCEHCRGTGFRATWLGGVLPIVPRR